MANSNIFRYFFSAGDEARAFIRSLALCNLSGTWVIDSPLFRVLCGDEEREDYLMSRIDLVEKLKIHDASGNDDVFLMSSEDFHFFSVENENIFVFDWTGFYFFRERDRRFSKRELELRSEKCDFSALTIDGETQWLFQTNIREFQEIISRLPNKLEAMDDWLNGVVAPMYSMRSAVGWDERKRIPAIT
jgi:hypothetical protein